MDLIKESNDLLNEFHTYKEDKDMWQTPFPIGVFGTLRRNRGNHSLMYGYKKWNKAFLPHFYPSGLSLQHHQGATAPFEVYFYNSKNWGQMIPFVERLEGFRPTSKQHYGYHRTLVRLHILPDDFYHPQWEENIDWMKMFDPQVKLEISQKDWHKYPTIPAWVYSNCRANNSSLQTDESPIIWTGIK